jgi:hypothetical protein
VRQCGQVKVRADRPPGGHSNPRASRLSGGFAGKRQLYWVGSTTRLILEPFSLVMLVEKMKRVIDAVEGKDPGTWAAPARS